MRTYTRCNRNKLGALVLLVGTAIVPSAVDAQTARGSFQRTLTVDGRPDIEIVSGSGGIEVRPGRDGNIEIRGEIRASDWGWNRHRLSPEERVRRIEANPPVEQNGSVIRIGHIDDRDLQNGVSISYTLTVPPASLMRSKTGSGSQRIEGIRGEVQSSTGSGSIVVRDVGSLSASTGSGSIHVDRVDGSFRASTGSGGIQATGIAGAITARTASGGIEVVQTGSGNVDVSSSSGTVRVRGVRGMLRAATSSGGLHIQGEARGEWNLTSSSGGIHIDLPESSGFELDATTSSGSIDVGMPISMASKSRRSLRGTVHGGGPRLTVRTTSGSIGIW